MKKRKRDQAIIQNVRVKSRDKELEMKDHLRALIDKKDETTKRNCDKS